VVAETLSFKGNAQFLSNKSTTVDLPAPEGPEIITSFPLDSVAFILIQYSELVL